MNNFLISKNITITVNGDKVTTDQKLYIFQNDRNIKIVFTIENLKFDFINNMTTTENIVDSMGATASRIKILKPKEKEDTAEGRTYTGKKIETDEGRVIFEITSEFTDEIEEIGKHLLQIQLYDALNGRITIPPIEFEILEPIFEDEIEIDEEDGQVDISYVGKCRVANDEGVVIQELQSRIQDVISSREGLADWKFGELITSRRLNLIHKNINDLWGRFDTIGEDIEIDAHRIKYNNENYPTVGDALDRLLYIEPKIEYFRSNISNILEKGQIISSIIFTWDYNKNIIKQSINNIEVNSSSRTFEYSNEFNNDKIFTLKFNDGKMEKSNSISFSFVNKIYWGVSYTTENLDDNFIKSIGNSELSNTRIKTINVNALGNQYIYYIIPNSYGTPIFKVGGFEGGFEKVSTLPFTNNYGHTENYNIYRSTNPNLGNTTVVIS